MRLSYGAVEADVVPEVGAAVTRLRVAGTELLATPPRPAAPPSAMADERRWVEAWRGGWQPALPNAGQEAMTLDVPEGFHGNASQQPWEVVDATAASAVLAWRDDAGLRSQRTLRLDPSGLTVTCVLTNEGPQQRPVAAVEHLVLGSDLLRSCAVLELAPAALLQELDYVDGQPTGAEPVPWPGEPESSWQSVTRETPPRAAVIHRLPGEASVRTHTGTVVVRWDQKILPYLWLWEEMAASREAPWHGQTLALGLEPSSVPHARGLDHATRDGSARLLAPGQSMRWSTDLRFLAATKEAADLGDT